MCMGGNTAGWPNMRERERKKGGARGALTMGFSPGVGGEAAGTGAAVTQPTLAVNGARSSVSLTRQRTNKAAHWKQSLHGHVLGLGGGALAAGRRRVSEAASRSRRRHAERRPMEAGPATACGRS